MSLRSVFSWVARRVFLLYFTCKQEEMFDSLDFEGSLAVCGFHDSGLCDILFQLNLQSSAFGVTLNSQVI